MSTVHELPYKTLSLAEIAALPIADLAAKDCLLFLWSTRKLFRDGVAAMVATAWGFKPCGEIIWGLRNPGMGTPGGTRRWSHVSLDSNQERESNG